MYPKNQGKEGQGSSTRAETKFFHREILGVGGPKRENKKKPNYPKDPPVLFLVRSPIP